jgi:hypothetical protein
LLTVSGVAYPRSVVQIRNQEQFDRIQQLLEAEINAGQRNILVVFSPGTYVAKEKHISLTYVTAPNAVLRFKGNGAILVPYGKDYKDGDTFFGSFSPYNSWMSGSNDVNVWSTVKYAEGQVEIINDAEKRCRIKTKETYDKRVDFSNAYILIPHGYQSSVYKVDRFEKGYLYFTATDLQSSAKVGYNVNDDFNYHKRAIRYKLSGVSDDVISFTNGKISLPANVSSIREGRIQHYFYFENCIFRSITIDGFSFNGNQSNPFVSSRAVLFFNNVLSKKISIQKCSFCGMKVNAISALSSPNVRIVDNTFSDCYYNAIEIDNNSNNAVVQKNTFNRMGKRMQNSFCVICRGTDYLIADNTFKDFGYSAIGVGVWYRSVQENPCNGIIERNTLEFTDRYAAEIDNYGIMDSGAIYLWTKNDGAVIRNNYISNYTGAGDNRGIFCDDGAYNFQIYGNLIMGIQNSYCIDSRRVSHVEVRSAPGDNVFYANVNNIIRDNYIDGNIQFVGNESVNNGCVKGSNFRFSGIGNQGNDRLMNTEERDDVILDKVNSVNGKILVRSGDYNRLRRSMGWRHIKKHIVRSQ